MQRRAMLHALFAGGVLLRSGISLGDEGAKRYRSTIEEHMKGSTDRWKNDLPAHSIDRDGKIQLNIDPKATPRGMAQQKKDDQKQTLAWTADPQGALIHLHETSADGTVEYWPQKKDFRKEQPGPDGTKIFRWINGKDEITGTFSPDIKKASMSIAGVGKINPFAKPNDLKKILNTPHRLAMFQWVFPLWQLPRSPAHFFATFRQNLGEWQKSQYRVGACNTFGEVACEVLSSHGYKMQILTFAPEGATIVEPNKFVDNWHIAAGFQTPQKDWMIIDGGLGRGDDRHLCYVRNPAEYAKRIGFQMSPVRPVISWRRNADPNQRFLQHVGLGF